MASRNLSGIYRQMYDAYTLHGDTDSHLQYNSSLYSWLKNQQDAKVSITQGVVEDYAYQLWENAVEKSDASKDPLHTQIDRVLASATYSSVVVNDESKQVFAIKIYIILDTSGLSDSAMFALDNAVKKIFTSRNGNSDFQICKSDVWNTWTFSLLQRPIGQIPSERTIVRIFNAANTLLKWEIMKEFNTPRSLKLKLRHIFSKLSLSGI